MVDILVLSVVLLCTILLLIVFLAVLRYWPQKKQKEVYRVAFKMPDAPQASPTTVEARPQLLSLSDDEIVFCIDEDDDEH